MTYHLDFGPEDGVRLGAVLADPARPEDTFTYPECAGFLFALSQSPDVIRPATWMDEVFNGRDPAFASREEANDFVGLVTRLYNAVGSEPPDDGPLIPIGCVLHSDAMKNFGEGSPTQQWCDGFAMGFDYVESVWEDMLEDDPWVALETMLMPLFFFRSVEIATDMLDAFPNPALKVEDLAVDCAHDLPLAAADYARLGRALYSAARQGSQSDEPSDGPENLN